MSLPPGRLLRGNGSTFSTLSRDSVRASSFISNVSEASDLNGSQMSRGREPSAMTVPQAQPHRAGTPSAAPKQRGIVPRDLTGAPQAPCHFRLLVTHEDGEQRFVPLYDSRGDGRAGRGGAGAHALPQWVKTPVSPEMRMDQFTMQELLLMSHGCLPLRLDKPVTKAHWVEQQGSGMLLVVTSLFRTSVALEAEADPASAKRISLQVLNTDPDPRGSRTCGTPAGTAKSPNCRTTFAVALIVALRDIDTAHTPARAPPSHPSELPVGGRADKTGDSLPLGRSLSSYGRRGSRGGYSGVGTFSATDDSAYMYARDDIDLHDSDAFVKDSASWCCDAGCASQGSHALQDAAARHHVLRVMKERNRFLSSVARASISPSAAHLTQLGSPPPPPTAATPFSGSWGSTRVRSQSAPALYCCPSACSPPHSPQHDASPAAPSFRDTVRETIERHFFFVAHLMDSLSEGAVEALETHVNILGSGGSLFGASATTTSRDVPGSDRDAEAKLFPSSITVGGGASSQGDGCAGTFAGSLQAHQQQHLPPTPTLTPAGTPQQSPIGQDASVGLILNAGGTAKIRLRAFALQHSKAMQAHASALTQSLTAFLFPLAANGVPVAKGALGEVLSRHLHAPGSSTPQLLSSSSECARSASESEAGNSPAADSALSAAVRRGKPLGGDGGCDARSSTPSPSTSTGSAASALSATAPVRRGPPSDDAAAWTRRISMETASSQQQQQHPAGVAPAPVCPTAAFFHLLKGFVMSSPADLHFISAVATAGLSHQGWVKRALQPYTDAGEGVEALPLPLASLSQRLRSDEMSVPLQHCKFLVHGADYSLVKAVVAVLSHLVLPVGLDEVHIHDDPNTWRPMSPAASPGMTSPEKDSTTSDTGQDYAVDDELGVLRLTHQEACASDSPQGSGGGGGGGGGGDVQCPAAVGHMDEHLMEAQPSTPPQASRGGGGGGAAVPVLQRRVTIREDLCVTEASPQSDATSGEGSGDVGVPGSPHGLEKALSAISMQSACSTGSTETDTEDCVPRIATVPLVDELDDHGWDGPGTPEHAHRLATAAHRAAVSGVLSAVAGIAASCPWLLPPLLEVEAQLHGDAQSSHVRHETHPLPSASYCHNAITVSATALPFLIAGSLQETVTPEEVVAFVETPLPPWMPENGTQRCVVIDVKARTCYVYDDAEKTRTAVLVSPTVAQTVKNAATCFANGVPSADCMESVEMGHMEVLCLAASVVESLEAFPPGTRVHSDQLRSQVLDLAVGDLPLVMALSAAIEPTIQVSGTPGEPVYCISRSARATPDPCA